MPHIVKSTILDAPTGAAWNVLRDFNGHDRWHPAVATSAIERGAPPDKVGCVRRFRLKDGAELREQLFAQFRAILQLEAADAADLVGGLRPLDSAGRDRRMPAVVTVEVA